MSNSASDPSGTVAVDFHIETDHFALSTQVTVPTGAMSTADLLPLVRALADRVVHETAAAVGRTGRKISCHKGCGACCCNLVAISEVEARRIAQVVDEMPEPRRTEIRRRFSDARQRLEKAGLLSELQRADEWTGEQYARLVGTYFRQRISCPFLEDGACSIYEERPVTCREYLVVSEPRHCAEDDSRHVVRLNMLLPVFNALARWQVKPPRHLMERVVPLILAPEWAGTHPEPPATRCGAELIDDLLTLLRRPSPVGHQAR